MKNWFDLLRLDASAHFMLLRKGARRLTLYRRTYLDLHKNSEINIQANAHLEFNLPWTKNAFFPGLLAMGENACLEVNNRFKIYSGAKVYINKGAVLKLGSGYINEGLSLACFQRIEIGHDVAIAERVTIRDSDNHAIASNPEHTECRPIRIGNHVWIGMNATILKGVTIGDGAIIAAGAVIVRDIPPACLAGGVPARILKRDVEWT